MEFICSSKPLYSALLGEEFTGGYYDHNFVLPFSAFPTVLLMEKVNVRWHLWGEATLAVLSIIDAGRDSTLMFFSNKELRLTGHSLQRRDLMRC